MASCKAGNCSRTCDNGCGCVAESANPANCSCLCSGGGSSKDLKLDRATPVDVSINELPFFEAAGFLNEVHTENIVAPIRRMNEQVSLNLEGRPFVEVLNQLDLTTTEAIERSKRKIGLLMFFVGFAMGVAIFSLVF